MTLRGPNLLRMALPLILAASVAGCQPPGPVPPAVTTQPYLGTLEISGSNVTVSGSPATNQMRVRNGDLVATGPASRARLWFNSGGFVQLEENTDPSFWETLLAEGECWIKSITSFGTVAGQTGTCKTEIVDERGNQHIPKSQYILTVSGKTSIFTLLEGSAVVKGRHHVQRLEPGEQVISTRDFVSEPRRLTEREIQVLLDWLNSFDFTGARPPIRPVAVPRIKGLDIDLAKQRLASQGLALGQVDRRSTLQAQEGTVLEQRPEPDAMVPPGTAVFVQVAVASVPPVRVPALRGLTVPQAEKRLAETDLRLGQTVRKETDKAKAGTVFSQDPGPGLRVRPGTAVDLVVAVAVRTPVPIQVPSLNGLTIDQANRTLAAAGLRLGQTVRKETDKAKAGTVFSQDPGPGLRVRPGTAVDVVVAVAVRTPVPIQAALARVETTPDRGNAHLAPGQGHVYDERFPTSGIHDRVPVNPGFYRNSQPATKLVHNLEHGHIVIYYESPGAEAMQLLKDWTSLYGGHWDGVIATPSSALGKTVVLTAWRKILRLDEFDPAAAGAFIGQFRGRGPEKPVR